MKICSQLSNGRTSGKLTIGIYELADSSLVKALNMALVHGLEQEVTYLRKQQVPNQKAINYYEKLKADMQNNLYNAGFLFPISQRLITDSLNWSVEPNQRDYILVFSQMSGIKESVRFSVFAKDKDGFKRYSYDDYQWLNGGVYSNKLETDILVFFEKYHLSNDQGNFSIVWVIRNGKIQAFPVLTSSGWFDERELFFANEVQ